MLGTLKKFLIYSLCFILYIFVTGCFATTQDMTGIEHSLKQMQRQLNELTKSYTKFHKTVQGNEANLKLEIEEAENNLEILKEGLEENRNEVSKLSQRLDDLEIKIMQLQQRLSTTQPATQETEGKPISKKILKPTDLYQVAYGDYISGNYDLSIVGFRDYLKKYPQGELSPSAQYWIGECYYTKGEFEKAVQEFNNVVNLYPRSAKVPTAKLKVAFSLYEMGKKDEARELLEDIIDEYPASSKEVKLAQEKLQMIKGIKKTAE